MTKKQEPQMPLVGHPMNGNPSWNNGYTLGKNIQRDAGMAWHKEKVQQVRKDTLLEVISILTSVDGDMVLDTDWSNGYTQAVKDIIKGLQSMAEKETGHVYAEGRGDCR